MALRLWVYVKPFEQGCVLYEVVGMYYYVLVVLLS